MAIKFKTPTRPSFSKEIDFAPVASDPFKMTFEFRYIPPKGIAEFMKNCEGRLLVDVLAGVILDWKGLQAEDNSQVPYSKEALTEFLDQFYVADVIFNRFIIGLRGAREKN